MGPERPLPFICQQLYNIFRTLTVTYSIFIKGIKLLNINNSIYFKYAPIYFTTIIKQLRERRVDFYHKKILNFQRDRNFDRNPGNGQINFCKNFQQKFSRVAPYVKYLTGDMIMNETVTLQAARKRYFRSKIFHNKLHWLLDFLLFLPSKFSTLKTKFICQKNG